MIIHENPIKPFICHSGLFVLDGALASELEVRGANLNDPLWSAKILLEQPDLLFDVNFDYLVSGSDMVTTATYQATIEGFLKKGMIRLQAEDLFRKAVEIARSARDKFWDDPQNRINRIKPLVIGSIGPYGAYLADGSEYSGNYNLSEDELKDFHRGRLKLLVENGVDLIAFETFPSFPEVKAVVSLLKEFSGTYAWLSLSSKNELCISDGTPIHEVAKFVDQSNQVVAIGVNCLPPEKVTSLLGSMAAVTEKPLLAYPNIGETWNAQKHCWEAGDTVVSIHDLIQVWYALGARLIGGCCRTTPSDIRKIKTAFSQPA